MDPGINQNQTECAKGVTLDTRSAMKSMDPGMHHRQCCNGFGAHQKQMECAKGVMLGTRSAMKNMDPGTPPAAKRIIARARQGARGELKRFEMPAPAEFENPAGWRTPRGFNFLRNTPPHHKRPPELPKSVPKASPERPRSVPGASPERPRSATSGSHKKSLGAR